VKDTLCEELERVFDQFRKYHLKIVLGDFSAKVGREYISKLTTGNKILHEIDKSNGVLVVYLSPFNICLSKVQRSHIKTLKVYLDISSRNTKSVRPYFGTQETANNYNSIPDRSGQQM
jgi:hypothetical protein